MTLSIKLLHATYFFYIQGGSMALDCERMGLDKKTKEEKLLTVSLGHFGPFQFEWAIQRIITEELSLDNDVIPLREFLKRYKAMEENILSEVAKLKEEIRNAKTIKA